MFNSKLIHFLKWSHKLFTDFDTTHTFSGSTPNDAGHNDSLRIQLGAMAKQERKLWYRRRKKKLNEPKTLNKKAIKASEAIIELCFLPPPENNIYQFTI